MTCEKLTFGGGTSMFCDITNTLEAVPPRFFIFAQSLYITYTQNGLNYKVGDVRVGVAFLMF